MVSYKKGLPDSGVEALRSELMDALNNAVAQLNQRINDLQARVAILEQAGNLSITNVTINSSARTITVEGSATDHDTGASVNLTINDSRGGTISGTATLTGAGTQTFSRVLDINPLSAGLLTIRATSLDRFGRAKEATESRNYTVNNSAILITSATINNTTSILSVSATANLQFPTAEDNVKDLKLDVTDSAGTKKTFSPTSHSSSGPSATWANINLAGHGYTSGAMTLRVYGTDKFGDPVEVSNTSNTYDPSNGGFIGIDTITVDDTNRNCDIRGTIWDADVGDSITIKVSGRQTTAIVQSDWIGSRGLPHQQNPEAKQFRLNNFNLNGLSFGNLSMNASGRDNSGRTVSAGKNFAFRPYSTGASFTTMDNTNKTLRVRGTVDYINSNVPVEITVTSSGGGSALVKTTSINGAGNFDTTFSVAALPYGNLSITTKVMSLKGTYWQQTRTKVFQEVSGDITISSFAIDSANDTATANWVLENATATKMEVIDSRGTKRSRSGTNIGATSGTIDISGLAYGPITVKVYGQDQGGGSVVDTDTKTYYDQTGSIDIYSLVTNTGSATLQMSVETPRIAVGSTVTWTISGQGNKSGSFTVTGNRTTTTISLSGIGYGGSNIAVQVTDAKGNAVNDNRNFTYSQPGSINISSVSVDSPKSRISVRGSTSAVNSGASVTITVRDSSGGSVSSTASVSGSNWSKSGMSISSLAYGNLTVEVSVTDTYGLTATDSDGPHQYSNLSGFVNIRSFVLTGGGASCSGTTSNVGNGTNINLEVRDGNGSTPHVARSTSVDSAGNFIISNIDIRGLDYGTLTAEVVTTDLAGDTVRDTETLSYTAPSGSIAINGFTVDSDEANSSNGYGTIDVSGAVSQITPGTKVTVTFWSSANPSYKITSSISVSGGSFRAANISVAGLGDGTISAQAHMTDVGGVKRTSGIANSSMSRAGSISSVSISLDDSGFDPLTDHFYDYGIDASASVSGMFGSNDQRVMNISPTSSGGVKSLTPTRSGNNYSASTTGSDFKDTTGIRATLGVTDMAGKRHAKASGSSISIYATGNIYAPTFTISAANAQARVSGTCTNIPNGRMLNVVIKRGSTTVKSFTTRVTATRNSAGWWSGSYDSSSFSISSWAYGNYTVYVSGADLMGHNVSDQKSASYNDPRPDGSISVTGANARTVIIGGVPENQEISVFGTSSNLTVGTRVTAKVYYSGSLKYTLTGNTLSNGNWYARGNRTHNLPPGRFTAVVTATDQKGISRTANGSGTHTVETRGGDLEPY